jgi:transcriptional regulator with XRE-family HTH domain
MWNSKRYKELLRDRGLTQAQVDKNLGVEPGLISKYMREVRTPTPEQLYRFLRAAGVTDFTEDRLIDWFPPDP